jgi:multiple sugar transport system ATP-binding protein
MASVSLVHLTRSFRTVAPAGVFDFSLEINDGESMAIVGPSGSGKTTILRLIAGLEKADSGSISIAGHDVTHAAPHQRNIGLVSQRPALYPHLNIRRNLSIGLEMSRLPVSQEEAARRVEEAIEFLELADVLDRAPHDLSGGEQQRVALGRLMVRRPAVWLLDEPFGHLDAGQKTGFRRQLHLLRGAIPTTMIIVTHDPVEAQTLGRRLAVLEAGKLQQVDSPAAIYARPANRFVASFLGWPAMNLADGILVRSPEPGKGLLFAAADGSFRLPAPAELVTHGAEGQPVTVGIRPEDVQSGRIPPPGTEGLAALPGWQVRLAEFLPPRWLTTLELGRQRWSVWSSEQIETGDRMDLAIPMARLHWFVEPKDRTDLASGSR